MAFTLTSPAFTNGNPIPAEYTCDGANHAPPLSWSGVPAGTRSLALIVDDPDAPDPAKPTRVFVHWVAYNLPPQNGGLAPGRHAADHPGAAGLNDWQRVGYGGPCPPIGRHRYFFTLYALDTVLPDLGAASKAELGHAMQGHVLETAQLVGTYHKQEA